MSASDTAAVQTPAPADHPSVAAPKCIDCKHHRTRQRQKGWAAADLCGHPIYPRDLITGEPTQICVDVRGAHLVTAGGLPPCGVAGTLYEVAEDDGPPVVTRTQLASALGGVLEVLDAATIIDRLADGPCKTSPRVEHARDLLAQIAAEGQP